MASRRLIARRVSPICTMSAEPARNTRSGWPRKKPSSRRREAKRGAAAIEAITASQFKGSCDKSRLGVADCGVLRNSTLFIQLIRRKIRLAMEIDV